jgi:hypothetical protein
MTFAEELDELRGLSAEELDQTSRKTRRELGTVEWKMGLCLLAWSRSEAFRELGYATVSEYGETVLNLSGRKIGALLGAARALEHLPILSEAYQKGEIGWGKVRVIHGLATPETEGEWLEFARAHSTAEVTRKVAFSPKAWKHHRALKASLKSEPIASAKAVSAVLRDEASAAARKVNMSLTERAAKEESTGKASCKRPEEPRRDEKERPALPVPPQKIRLLVELTPDQYALYEQAEIRLRAQAGKHINRAQVVTAMAEKVLNQGTARSRSKHQILIHTVEGSEGAWYDTDRGMLPVSPEVLRGARDSETLPTDTHRDAFGVGQTEKNKDHSGDLQAESVNGANRRQYIPSATIRALYTRAVYRCERCRERGALHIHHTIPVSEGGDNSLHNLKLFCLACHNLQHIRDFAHKPYWRLAKEAAMESRVRPRDRTEPVSQTPSSSRASPDSQIQERDKPP